MLLVFLSACNRKPFVEQKITLEKKSNDCIGIQSNFRMDSNFGGERFEFERCLPADYDKALLTTARSGDTVLVNFNPVGSNKTSNRFQVTLDIDTYPEYHFISIDGETFNIIPANP